MDLQKGRTNYGFSKSYMPLILFGAPIYKIMYMSIRKLINNIHLRSIYESIYDVTMKYHTKIDRPSKIAEQNNKKRSIASFCGMSTKLLSSLIGILKVL